FTFAVYLLLWTNIHGAITAGTAAFVGALFSEAFGISMGIVEWYVVLTLPIAALVFYSKYEWLENLLKTFVVFLGLIVVLTVL
ncbi:MAG: hypothetical protein SV760_04885, partial [Halobacteria archaeon]|nr:hypothetical protein [Halobacteria archaeon]